MDINEDKIKEEVSSFVSSLQRLLPKKKEIIVVEPQRHKTRKLCDIHAEAKSTFPKCFIGARLIVLREVLDKVKLVQQYSYGKTRESYRCYSQLIHKEMEPKSTDEGLLIDSSGSATATYKDSLDGEYQMRLMSRIRDLVSSETEIVFEKENEKSVGSVSCSVRDVDPNTLRMVTQWMYKILPEVCFGTEIGFKPLMYPPTPEISISARYDRPSFTLSSTASKIGFQVCFYKQFSPDLRLATIITEGCRGGQTTVSLAMHKNYQNGSELKIFVDSQRCGGFTFQRDILFYEPQNEARVLRLVGSTLIDKQRRVRFGIGINLDF
ncbi:mitochondrial import receptor subunit TOM40 homolog [Spodoptera frugiperda]|uniref:Mitochondrial import receptor subunit TOM40 homolog n=1 Tax=Spodoptera frugiperda TaxID=7108 RepID=A0A9R0D7M5_SPOFR|nr:mitochondrial import receptor subunit TOM40 homolog [Spodoptera frugiperda]